MNDNVYRLTEVIGSSSKSIEDAIQNAISRTAETVDHLGWFEVTDTRGHIENGKIAHYQVTVKIGFTHHSKT